MTFLTYDEKGHRTKGGAAILKVGVASENIFAPPLSQMWGYEQANVSRLIEYTEICCLAVALINMS